MINDNDYRSDNFVSEVGEYQTRMKIENDMGHLVHWFEWKNDKKPHDFKNYENKLRKMAYGVIDDYIVGIAEKSGIYWHYLKNNNKAGFKTRFHNIDAEVIYNVSRQMESNDLKYYTLKPRLADGSLKVNMENNNPLPVVMVKSNEPATCDFPIRRKVITRGKYLQLMLAIILGGIIGIIIMACIFPIYNQIIGENIFSIRVITDPHFIKLISIYFVIIYILTLVYAKIRYNAVFFGA